MRYTSLISIIYLLSCSAPAEVNQNMISYNGAEHAPQKANIVATAQGEGKYIILHVDKQRACNTIYIEQNSGSKFSEYIIESLKNDSWHKIHEGSNPTRIIVLRFEPRYFNKLRLHIKRSNKIPRIDSFALYYE